MRKLLLLACAISLTGCVDSTKLKSANYSSSTRYGGHTSSPTVVTLMSAEQMVKSMASVSQVPISSTINNEFNARRSLMTDNYSITSVTSPMLISVTNLSSQFCNAILAQEVPLSAGQRRFFNSVDFTKPLSSLSESQFSQVIDKLGENILGRLPTAEEKKILSEARTEFEAAIPTANSNQSSQTRLLMLFSCSGLMSSFDFITI